MTSTGGHNKLLDEDQEQEINPTSNANSQIELQKKLSKKRKYLIIGGISILVFAVVLTLILVFALKSDDDHPVPPPLPDETFDPYEVEEFDEDGMQYSMVRNGNIAFDYPYMETANNRFINNVALAGSLIGTPVLNLRFSDKSAKKAES